MTPHRDSAGRFASAPCEPPDYAEPEIRLDTLVQCFGDIAQGERQPGAAADLIKLDDHLLHRGSGAWRDRAVDRFEELYGMPAPGLSAAE